jgi:hypothetical protein
LRRVPRSRFVTLLPCPLEPQPGDVALARLDKIGKNTRLELATGRSSGLNEGDPLAVVFGNHCPTGQCKGYARLKGNECDLLSVGGLCGLMESKYNYMPEPSKLRILGTLGDAQGRPLQLRDFSLPLSSGPVQMQVAVVCGTSTGVGKTYTASSLIRGLRHRGERVTGIKLTGTTSGRDTWTMLDAGASPALDFIDGGFPSTYRGTVEELLRLYFILLAQAALLGARWAVVEIGDGLLQPETAALLQSPTFRKTVSHWFLATGDTLGGHVGMRILRAWGIEPNGISGFVSTSPLALREVEFATGVRCVTAKELQTGELLDSENASSETSIRETAGLSLLQSA